MAINKIDEVVIAPSLRQIIDNKAEKTYVDNIHTDIENEISAVVNNMDWKETVNTYDDIATTYPTPDDGWTVNVKNTDITYRYDSTLKVWIPISANSIPLATSSVDGKMSKADKAKLDGIESGAEVNPTATEILNSLKTVDGSGSGLDADLFKGKSDSYYLDYNNFSNVPDVYTKIEINTQMNGKVDKASGKGLSTNDFDNTYKTKVDGIASGATKVEDSTTNGNIKINGTEDIVYTHPTSGATAGTYKSVIVDKNGHVTAGDNPTTLGGYGITDAYTKTEVDAKMTNGTVDAKLNSLILGNFQIGYNSDQDSLDFSYVG